MKTNFLFILILLCFIVILSNSCSTDVNINADYKEIPVVFCVLNPSQEYQYVKINKTFLGEKNASEVAQISDSLFFREEIKVNLYKLISKDTLSRWEFERYDGIPKDDGEFAHDKNILYRQKIDFGEAAENHTYLLMVNIGNGRHKIKGTTKLVFGEKVTYPNENIKEMSYTGYTVSSQYRYQAGYFSMITQVVLRFNYLEVKNNETIDSSKVKSIIIPLENKILDNKYINGELPGSFAVISLYSYIKSNILPEEGVKRYVKMPNSIDYIITSADENYYTYMQVSKPSGGIAQFRPTWTNLENNGSSKDVVGVFASRNSKPLSVKMSQKNIDTLFRGIHTRNLGFVRPYDEYYHPYFQDNW